MQRMAVFVAPSPLTKVMRETVATIRGRGAEVRARSPQQLAGKLRELRHGAALDPVTAVKLLQCDDELLPELLAAARELKETHHPGVITYSRKVFLPLTNLCRDYCGYCTFRRDPGEPGAHTMTPDEVLSVAREGEKLGCTEALFSLGDRPEALFPEMRETLRRLGYRSTLHYLEAMCELVLRETKLLPHANPGLLSANWIERLRVSNPSLGLMLESTSTQLADGASYGDDAGQSSRAAAANHRRCGQARRAVHHGNPDRHRRDDGGSRRFPAGDQAAA